MIHYHGTPISPVSAFYQVAGRHFCVSYAAPQDVRRAHDLGQSVLLDNGAFSVWRRGLTSDWPGYYRWADEWLQYPTTWAIIPDVIDGSEEQQDALITQWPHGTRGSPVWHMNENIERLLRLVGEWERVCIGSTAEFAVVLSDSWQARMDMVFNAVALQCQRTPWLHMLRGMRCSGMRWPFASVDSTDLARNHNRPQNSARLLADRWDGLQCPARWIRLPEQERLLSCAH